VLASSSAAAQGRCDATIPIYGGGVHHGDVCASDVAARGLTTVDLADDFAPYVFSEDPSLGEAGVQPYRAIFVALADERFDALPEHVAPERYLELFGIFPTFRVLLARLSEDARHTCHASIDDSALAALTGTIRPFARDIARGTAQVTLVRQLRARLERGLRQRGVQRFEQLADDSRYGSVYERWARDRVPVEAVEAVQAHLRCDGWLEGRVTDGVFGRRSALALAEFQRRHVVVGPAHLDAQTRTALRVDSREADFRSLLRALRERVVDAAALLEDGSAQHAPGLVLGRELDPAQMHEDAGQPALANGAPDLVSRATEAAARALGLTTPDEARRALTAMRQAHVTHVALRLPPPPRYYSAHMELRAEIDRGDVWYDYPYTSSGRPRRHPIARQPVLTLYARDGDHEVALVRWPTTIGGWKPERTGAGATVLTYKGSPVGPRVWRDLVASPAWLPPPSTPADDLVTRTSHGYVPNYALFGPGYRSAYGLAMLMHHRVIPATEEGAEPTYSDQGVRTHGSVSYRSIAAGTSHGCHRLYNHLAVRLTSFLLRHRHHVRDGSLTVRYSRVVGAGGLSIRFELQSRGYRFELTPPVRVDVLEGTIHGATQEPPTGSRPLRDTLLRRRMEEEAGLED